MGQSRRIAQLAGCDGDAIRINVFTPGEGEQGEWEVDAYSIEGGELRLVGAEEELAAYSPTGWTHLRILEMTRQVPSRNARGYAYWPVAAAPGGPVESTTTAAATHCQAITKVATASV